MCSQEIEEKNEINQKSNDNENKTTKSENDVLDIPKTNSNNFKLETSLSQLETEKVDEINENKDLLNEDNKDFLKKDNKDSLNKDNKNNASNDEALSTVTDNVEEKKSSDSSSIPAENEKPNVKNTNGKNNNNNTLTTDLNNSSVLIRPKFTNPGLDYWRKKNPVADKIFITDVTVDLNTVTIRECATEKGFFRERQNNIKNDSIKQ